MNTPEVYYIIPVLSLVFAFIIINPLRKLAIKVGLVDNPNARKVHKSPIPLVGGMAIVFSAGLALMFAPEFWDNLEKYNVLIIGSVVLLIMGVYDDRNDMRAILKLIVQIILAHFAFVSGIRLDSMFGIFGIYELPIAVQYLLTLVVIAGVINAFNLMDGIDGLAAGLAVVGLSAFTYVAFITGNTYLAILYLSLIGALIGFLRFNFSKKSKIFMGDAGSLVLGYILVVSGIMLMQSAYNSENGTVTQAVVIGVLVLPVIDSLRVYRRRIKTGYSPFRADKTHFHHMVLFLGIPHKWASFLIVFFSLCIIVLSIVLSIVFGNLFSMTYTIIALLLVFVVFSSILGVNSDINTWKEKIKKLEEL